MGSIRAGQPWGIPPGSWLLPSGAPILWPQLSTNLFAVLAIGAGRKLSDLLIQRLRTSFQIANLERDDQPRLVIRTGSAYYDPLEPSSPEELFGEATRAITV